MKVRTLVITNLFPSQKEPNRSPFNKQQIIRLGDLCDIKIVAPIPWYQHIASKREMFDGVEVYRPRYWFTPKVGRCFYGLFFFISIYNTVIEIYKGFKFEIILATWAYPDGFASYLLSKMFRKPIIIKVHGTDIYEFSRYFIRRKMIVFSTNRADKVIAVSRALKEKMIGIGIKEEKIKVIYNGVDNHIFHPVNKEIAQTQLGFNRKERHILYVGNLKPVKGLKYLIEAVSLLLKKKQRIHLHIIGRGILKSSLEKIVASRKINEYVHFEGEKDHKNIAIWMNAADLLCVPSLSEGVPNVILESLSCGTPVVASNVGGIPEVLTSEVLGTLVPSEDVVSLGCAIEAALSRMWNKIEITDHMTGRFSWESSAKELYGEIASISSSTQ